MYVVTSAAAAVKGPVPPYGAELHKLSRSDVKHRTSEMHLDLESLTYYPPCESNYDPVYGYDSPPVMIAAWDNNEVVNDK